jgi:hypothetical protein
MTIIVSKVVNKVRAMRTLGVLKDKKYTTKESHKKELAEHIVIGY